MKQLHGLDGLRELPPLAAGGAGVVLSVGNFDGMHRGHGRIIETAAELAREHNAALAVATFEPHPLTVLRPGHAPPRLTPAALKEALLETAGVDYL
ncbi:MAG TPA: adenylyltransferase/cytidyltransferase family protein, partial [Tepidisphaeraceae bacterium]